jgi:hypothetical protein
MTMAHLCLVAGGGDLAVSRATPDRDICFLDYSHCGSRDTCWLIDGASGCEGHDGCIIDTD